MERIEIGLRKTKVEAKAHLPTPMNRETLCPVKLRISACVGATEAATTAAAAATTPQRYIFKKTKQHPLIGFVCVLFDFNLLKMTTHTDPLAALFFVRSPTTLGAIGPLLSPRTPLSYPSGVLPPLSKR
jgi:hypothetical protein